SAGVGSAPWQRIVPDPLARGPGAPVIRQMRGSERQDDLAPFFGHHTGAPLQSRARDARAHGRGAAAAFRALREERGLDFAGRRVGLPQRLRFTLGVWNGWSNSEAIPLILSGCERTLPRARSKSYFARPTTRDIS